MDREAATLVASLHEPGPFGAIAGGFGRLAHYVTDAGYPPLAGGTDDEKRYADFAAFCESRRERFPLVFYGHEDTNLSAGDWDAWVLTVMQRANGEDAMLARAYAAAGDPPAAWAFDDRSVPFAVGSLAYSRTITDIVRVWIALWQKAGGDVGRTPYRQE